MAKTYNDSIIADTSGLVSLFVPTDHNHTVAVKEALKHSRKDIVVIHAVYIEFVNVVGKLSGHKLALAAADMIAKRFVLLDEPRDILASGALEKFADLPEGVSLTDCLVMATADAYQTKEIFGFDKQFADAGYIRISPSTKW
jgi:predicted nucleic acid-binding protein